MFLTFVSTPNRARSASKGRPRVRHACEHCRLFRVRCDGLQPCARCHSRHRSCVYLRRSPRQNQPCANSPLEAKPDPAPAPDSAPASVPAAAPALDPPPISSSSPDSATAFAAKINRYFSSIATVVPEQVLETSPPPQYSAFASAPQSADQPPLHLTPAQRRALLRLYVRRIHAVIPVVDLEQLRISSYDDPEELSCPLLRAVFALSIQYAACSGLASRMLDLQIPGTAACTDASLAGYELIARYRGLLTGDSLEPSLIDLQCHVLMALFLVNAGQLKAAYNLLGSAVRIAFCLDLHRSVPGRDDELCRRLWWCLVQLDLKCSFLLSRPTAFHRSDMSCPFPTDLDNRWSFHVHSVRLTAAVLSVTSASARQRELDSATDLNLSEAHAQSLTGQLGPILEWEASVHHTDAFSWLELDPEATVTAFDQAQDQAAVFQDDDLEPTTSMQGILLKIHYHNSLMGLFRSFIHFPFKSISPARSPFVDRHATCAVAHGLALTATVIESFRRSDLFYGWCDIYQALWDSLLTMAGFILSYPLCRYSCKARLYFPMALAVFDTISPRLPTASRFAALGRDLFSRVERLVAFVEENQRQKDNLTSDKDSGSTLTATTTPSQPAPAMNSLTSGRGVSEALGDAEQAFSVSASTEPSHVDHALFGDDAVAAACDQDMWSWMDIVNPPNWPDYQDGIEKLFTDISDLDLLMEEPWRNLQE